MHSEFCTGNDTSCKSLDDLVELEILMDAHKGTSPTIHREDVIAYRL